MAKLPVGYRSPFKNKSSPMKQIPSSMYPALIGAGAQILGGMIGGKARRKEQAEARREMTAARKAYMDIQFTNPFAGMENPYQENLYEDLTVNRQAADYARQQSQQQQANIMQGLKGAAGASGVAGLAQSMANIGAQQAQKASASIAQQERQNELYRAKGEQTKRRGSLEFDQMMRAAQYKTVDLKEQQRTENLFGLSIDRLSAADRARAAARSQVMAGVGQGIAAYGSTYMPGGMNYQGGVEDVPAPNTFAEGYTGAGPQQWQGIPYTYYGTTKPPLFGSAIYPHKQPTTYNREYQGPYNQQYYQGSVGGPPFGSRGFGRNIPYGAPYDWRTSSIPHELQY